MEIQMTINVSAQTAVKIAELLAGENKVGAPVVSAAASTPVQNTAPIQTTTPVQAASAPTQQTVPTAPIQQQTAPVQSAVPVAPPCEYTIEQIQLACAPLMDAGRQQELVNLLAQFGVQALPQLQKEQLGAFATALRGLGAKI